METENKYQNSSTQNAQVKHSAQIIFFYNVIY